MATREDEDGDCRPRVLSAAVRAPEESLPAFAAAFAFAEEVLDEGGGFVAKVLQGGGEAALLARMKRAFRRVRHAKPPASRAESAETYLVALGFRG